ncbi:LOW QUALITY PROTEIN: hypothetical protein U9M48_012391 [Paspalum notatum var. saurae]|uniref:Reverse transcriptase zinc-binding domain-containing protein n=1 Tax=Paspalum notatum var. saurae TaxID=547442 RepID=A0AAQ3SXT5_PASNO
MGHDVKKATNMKLILCAFEHLSGLKINYHKSELFCYGEASKFQEQYSQRINNKDWREVENRFEKKLSSWKGKHLSYGGRLVLINSCLTSLALFMLSFFEIPRGVLKKLDYYRSRFFWQGDGPKKKYRLDKWKILCTPKEQGVLRNKFGNQTTLPSKKKPGDSQFWSGLMKVKPIFLNGESINGSQERFWEDNWLGNILLSEQYPVIYNIVHRKHDIVATVMSISIFSESTGRESNKLQAWHDLVGKITNIILNDQPDQFRWLLTKNGLFTVHSMYKQLISIDVFVPNRFVWQLKVPHKIKIFIWLLFRRVILTKDNLIRRHWQCSKQCCFCSADETIQHLRYIGQDFRCYYKRRSEVLCERHVVLWRPPQ